MNEQHELILAVNWHALKNSRVTAGLFIVWLGSRKENGRNRIAGAGMIEIVCLIRRVEKGTCPSW